MSETAITASLKSEETIASAFRKFAALELDPEVVDCMEIAVKDAGETPQRFNTALKALGRKEVDDSLRFALAVAECEDLRADAVALIEKVIAHNTEDGVLYVNEEHPFGTDLCLALALRSAEHVSLYVRFLSTLDMNHEVFESSCISAVIAQHGFGEATWPLIAARATSCGGQHGADQMRTWFAETHITDGADAYLAHVVLGLRALELFKKRYSDAQFLNHGKYPAEWALWALFSEPSPHQIDLLLQCAISDATPTLKDLTGSRPTPELMKRLNQYALADATRDIEKRPDAAKVWSWRGYLSLIMFDDPKGALADLDMALSLDPARLTTTSYKIVLHLRNGDSEAARELLDSCADRLEVMDRVEQFLMTNQAQRALDLLAGEAKDYENPFIVHVMTIVAQRMLKLDTSGGEKTLADAVKEGASVGEWSFDVWDYWLEHTKSVSDNDKSFFRSLVAMGH